MMQMSIVFWLALPFSPQPEHEIDAKDLAEFIVLAKEIGDDRWYVRYSGDDKLLTLNSRSKVKGIDSASSLPNDFVGDYQVSIALKITDDPSEDRIRDFRLMEKKRNEYFATMSRKARAKAGFSKNRPKTLTKAEWIELIEFSELRRKTAELELPTHRYKSINFVDISHWQNIELQKKQTPQASRLLMERKRIIGLLEKIDLPKLRDINALDRAR